MAIRIDPALMERYLDAELASYRRVDAKWEKFIRNRVWNLVPLDCGVIFVITKEKIETDFCFGESGYDIDQAYKYVEQAQTSKLLFRERNLRNLDEKLHMLRNDFPADDYRRYCAEYVWISPARGICEYLQSGDRYAFERSIGVGLTDADRARLIDAYEACRKDMEKRIDNYLKRYGLSKVRAWTYWRDA